MYTALLTKPDDIDDHPIQMIHFQCVSHRVKQAGPATLRLNDRRVQIPIVYLFGRSVPLECDCGSEGASTDECCIFRHKSQGLAG